MTAVQPSPTTPADLVPLALALTELLDRETALVRVMKIAEIEPLQADKSRLTGQFQQALSALQAGGLDALAGPARLQWLAAGQRLAAAVMENERALRIGRVATERLVAAVVTAVQQTRHHPAGYSARRAGATGPSVAGIAIDHRL